MNAGFLNHQQVAHNTLVVGLGGLGWWVPLTHKFFWSHPNPRRNFVSCESWTCFLEGLQPWWWLSQKNCPVERLQNEQWKKNTGCFGCIGGYTTICYRVYYIHYRNPYETASRMESSKVFLSLLKWCLLQPVWVKLNVPRGTFIDGKATESNLQKNMRKHGQCWVQ